MRREQTSSYPVSIFVAGDVSEAREICRAFCDEEGLCVTVTPTTYVYTDGEEAGVIVGLINYPRFPSEPSDIVTAAKLLALELMHKLGQESVTVQTPDETCWFSIRTADLAIADTRRMAETENTGSVRSTGSAVPERQSPNLSPKTCPS
jgi:hypothetical protein